MTPPFIVSGKLIVSVSVREMVSFVLRTGDLGAGHGFVGPNRALEGTRGHQRLQKKRPSTYEAEVAVSVEIEDDDFTLRIKGRIDGVLIENGSLLIEEIKTIERPRSGPADPLHWAQAKIYALLYAREHGFSGAEIRITYLNLASGETVEFQECFTIASLGAFFDSVVAEYLQWIRELRQWHRLRDQSIQDLAFPFAKYRAGQRSLAVAVYRTIKARGRLFAEAPTGIGKTVSVLFPAIKAMGEGRVEKIFYTTARTVGRTVVEKAVIDLRTGGLHLRAVTITARDKICFNNGQPCDTATCPFAIGYYDRVKAAMRDALRQEAFQRTQIEEIARKHQVCPFELSLDLSVWVDLIICDYNYVFDPSVSLKRYFDDEKHDYAILVDEAHNLVDRAREMFSASLDRARLLAAKAPIQPHLPKCAKALGTIASRLAALKKEEDWTERENALVAKTPPEIIQKSLKKFLELAEAWLAQNEQTDFRLVLLDAYFAALAFQRTLELYDERYISTFDKQTESLRLFCLDPSALIRQILRRAGAVVFFSATLTPHEYFRKFLSEDPLDTLLRLNSPFPEKNLLVMVHDQIATRLVARAASHDAVASAIGAMVRAKTGNYLVYFPSYIYMMEVLERFRRIHPACRTQAQAAGMTEFQREQFMEMFRPEGEETLVAFAVLGGIFGEGIDLVGERLIGVAIVGVGLPQICLERDLIKEHCQQSGEPGFDQAYTFPGINRVLQAAGRVIRSETDQGIVLLIDERFRQPTYRNLLPAWWTPKRVRSQPEITEMAKQFWEIPEMSPGTKRSES